MVSKRKRNRQSVPDQLFERAQRDLAKGNAKGALKDAKVCFRGDASPRNRQLLEQAFLGRAQQLHGMMLLDEARAVLDELIGLGPTTPEVNAQLGRLRVLLGGSGAEASRLLAEDPSLLVQMADEAVLDHRAAMPCDALVRTHVEQVRQGLLAVERGEDEAAAELIKDIPRSSPLSDWKLLVRGLSAFYQRDRQRCEQNWQRLAPTRPAWRIAQTLRVAAGEVQAGEVSVDISASLRRLKQGLPADPVSASLQQLSSDWQQGNWNEYLRALRALRQSFAKTHSQLLESIVDLTWKRAIRERDHGMLEQVIAIGLPPRWDPRWNRARALLAEEHLGEASVSQLVEYWTAYAADVEKMESLPAVERPIAVALVHQHLARLLVRCANEKEENPFSFFDQGSASQFRTEAARCYRKSIESFERLETAYKELAQLHQNLEEPEKSAAVFQRLIHVLPDNYEAHLWLANYHLGRDLPDKSKQHVDAALRLKPRDDRAVTLRWNQRVTMIRCLTKSRLFEAARREVDEAANFLGPGVEPYTLHTMRAGIELKAKRSEQAQQQLDAALRMIEEPTALWLQMSCTVARYGLPRDVKKDFDNRYKDAIEHPPTSQTAGRLARFFRTLRGSQVNYTGRATQERLFLKYLGGTRRLKWAERDLCDVCQFLWMLPKDHSLCGTLITSGLKQFPDCPLLHLLAGELEIARGPFGCAFETAHRHLQRAVQLTRDSLQKEDTNIFERAHQALALLDATKTHRPSFMFSDDDDEYDDDEDDEYEYDEYEDGYDDGYDGPLPNLRSLGDADLQQLFRTAPPEIVETLTQAAAKMGVPPVELLQRIFTSRLPELLGAMGAMGESGEPPRGGKKKRR